MGGTVKVHSDGIGKGTTFTIQISSIAKLNPT
jgi:signal transduction histidine kinase